MINVELPESALAYRWSMALKPVEAIGCHQLNTQEM